MFLVSFILTSINLNYVTPVSMSNCYFPSHPELPKITGKEQERKGSVGEDRLLRQLYLDGHSVVFPGVPQHAIQRRVPSM